jgi:hypothetical protein
MVGLLEIAPVDESVDIDGQQLSVPGISGLGFAHLLQCYPELRNFFGNGVVEMNAKSIIEKGPKIASAVMAAGCGYPGDAKAEKKLETFSVGTQVEILNAVLRKTLPRGFGPFVADLAALMERISPQTMAERIKAAGQGKPSTNSHKPSNASSPSADIQPPTSGP